MATRFKIEIDGLNKLMQKLSVLPKNLSNEIDGEIEAAFREINRKQVRGVPVDEGGLKQSLGYKRNGPMDYELFGNKSYMPYIEFGTKTKVRVPSELTEYAMQFKGKGSDIKFDDFLLIILDWVHRKGIAGRFSVKTKRRVGSKNSQFDEDFAAAYPIAISILRKGIKPQPFFFQPYFEEKAKLIQRIKKMINNL